MLYCYRKFIDYKTVISRPTRKEAKAAINTFKKIIVTYLNYKYSCNPTIKDESYTACKVRLIELFEENSFTGFSVVKDMISYNSDNRLNTSTTLNLTDSDDESAGETETTVTPSHLRLLHQLQIEEEEDILLLLIQPLQILLLHLYIHQLYPNLIVS